jgi:Niemann-Pick C1 protein
VRERLPWFLDALPSEDCAKGGAGAYTDALQRSSKEPSGIKARALKPFFHTHPP